MDRSWTVNVLCPLPSTTSLALSPPASTLYGQQVRLTATVSPASATGQVSFYDGAFFLGSNSLSGGTASIQSVTLRPGPHSIRTRYPGDGIGFSPSLSSASALSVSTVRSDTFVSSPSNPVNTGTTPVSVTPGDFNGDGKTDLAVANAFSNNRTLYKGDGAGAFHPARRGDNRGLHADCFGSR